MPSSSYLGSNTPPSPPYLAQHPTPDHPLHGHFPPLLELCHPTPGKHSLEVLFLSYWGSNSPHWTTPPPELMPYPARVFTLYASFPLPWRDALLALIRLWRYTQATPTLCREALVTLLRPWHPTPLDGPSTPCSGSRPLPPPHLRDLGLHSSEKEEKC